MSDDVLFRAEDLLLDDSHLLADRLLRSLHRNKDGHLATSKAHHKQSVEGVHNMAVLFCYTLEEHNEYVMHEHYVYSPDTHSYASWSRVVRAEAENLHKYSGDNFHGVYGWTTAYIRITPLRTGDLFIKIDAEGARGVRLAFSPRKNKHAPRSKAVRKS